MSQLFANNARSRLVSGISASATTLTVESATADLFPIANTPDWLSPVNWFKAVLQNALGQTEIIYVGVRNSGSGVFSNLLRGQEGTTARIWNAGDVVGQRLTALDHEGLVNIKSTNNTFTGDNLFTGEAEFTQPILGDLEGNADTATLAAVATTVPDLAITTAKLAARAVTAAKMLASATARIWGRVSADSGDVEQLTGAQVQTLLPIQQTRVSVASAGTVDLTAGAPSTDHVNITGTTSITGFTVAAGRTIFARFNASLTLTNNANIVTQSGANIVTQAGDTCILRATAANVVEVLAYTRGVPQALGDGQTWQNVTASRAMNTTYTNTTGRPIYLSVTVGASVAANVALLINGVTVGQTNNDSNFPPLVCTIVLPGNTYRINTTAGLISWFELVA